MDFILPVLYKKARLKADRRSTNYQKNSVLQKFQIVNLVFPKNSIAQNHGYFLKGLFSEVILKDKNLVKQHINPKRKRQRYLVFIVSLLTVSMVLGVWLWSYRNNQQLIADVQKDLQKVVQMQKTSGQELSTQLDALLILQQRLVQLDEYDQVYVLYRLCLDCMKVRRYVSS